MRFILWIKSDDVQKLADVLSSNEPVQHDIIMYPTNLYTTDGSEHRLDYDDDLVQIILDLDEYNKYQMNQIITTV